MDDDVLILIGVCALIILLLSAINALIKGLSREYVIYLDTKDLLKSTLFSIFIWLILIISIANNSKGGLIFTGILAFISVVDDILKVRMVNNGVLNGASVASLRLILSAVFAAKILDIVFALRRGDYGYRSDVIRSGAAAGLIGTLMITLTKEKPEEKKVSKVMGILKSRFFR